MAGSSIGTLKAFLTMDPSGFIGGFGAATKAASGFGSGLLSSVKGNMIGLTTAAVGTGAAMLTAALSTRSMIESLDRVGHLASVAKKLGLSVEETQRLGIAAEKSGVDLDTLANGMLMMGKNIGTGGLSLDKRLGQVADQFVKIKDVGKRAEFSRGVFGKGGFEYMNLLAKGSSGIRQSADAIDKFGLTIKDIDAANAKEAVLSLKEVKVVLLALKDKFMVSAGFGLTSFFRGMKDELEPSADLLKRFGVTLDSIKLSATMAGAGAASGFKLARTEMEILVGRSQMFLNTLMMIKAAASGDMAGMMMGAINRDNAEKNVEKALKDQADVTSGAFMTRVLFGGKGGKGMLGGMGGGAPGGSGGKFASALERGSVGAASAITNANANPFSSIEKNTKDTVAKLTLVERGIATIARRTNQSPLRPSNLRGGGSK